MKRFALLASLAAFLMGALWLANVGRQQTPAYLLSRYPSSANFDGITQNHLRPAPAMLFQSDWFPNDTTASAMGCKIDQNGSEVCESYSENTVGSAGLSLLSPATLARFQTALRALPPGETAPPPISRLLVVSFRDGARWQTRLYNRTRPPVQLVALAKIAGFRGLQFDADSG